MSDHLPECRRWFTDMPDPDECPACEMFRACEQRVLQDAVNSDAVRGAIRIAEQRTLDAARDAVAAYRQGLMDAWDQCVAAIDALRGES